MREYVVLYASDPDGPFNYAATETASSAWQAIDRAQSETADGGWIEAWPVWVAVPTRNWSAVADGTETKRVRAEARLPEIAVRAQAEKRLTLTDAAAGEALSGNVA